MKPQFEQSQATLLDQKRTRRSHNSLWNLCVYCVIKRAKDLANNLDLSRPTGSRLLGPLLQAEGVKPKHGHGSGQVTRGPCHFSSCFA